MLTYSWMTPSDSFLFTLLPQQNKGLQYFISCYCLLGLFYYIEHRSPDCTKAPVVKPYVKDNLYVKKLVP